MSVVRHGDDDESILDAALEYLERGWSIIPVRVSGEDKKIPLIRWREFQERPPTEEEVRLWLSTWPEAGLALVTGHISKVYIVDCDNQEAIDKAMEMGMSTVVKSHTQRGSGGGHLYFASPMDGKRRQNRVGISGDNVNWPNLPGLDFRGDGGYALLPPSKGYQWDIPPQFEWSDMDAWMDITVTSKVVDITTGGAFDLSSLDLSLVRANNHIPEWDRTFEYVKESFPTTLKIPSGQGNGRNERLMRHISDCILQGFWGEDLRSKGTAFMNKFFEESLDAREFSATVESMEGSERRNHPERFNDAGQYVFHQDNEVLPKPSKSSVITLITEQDAPRLIAEASNRNYLISPWCWPGSITQVYGYSGSGKTMFLQHILYSLASGQSRFGPFELGRPCPILYLDFEMGRGTIGSRLLSMEAMFGSSGGLYQVWAPFVDDEMDLKSRDGRSKLSTILSEIRPSVIVIDTNRSAFVGLEENSADGWSHVNKLLMKLRDMGMAVISVHHSNKPGESGLGREAGSTSQLAVLDTQIRVAQVYADEELARQNSGIYDGSYGEQVIPSMERSLPNGYYITFALELRYRKIREFTEHHEWVQWVGIGSSPENDTKIVVGSRSVKQKAQALAASGATPIEIAERLRKPLKAIREWTT